MYRIFSPYIILLITRTLGGFVFSFYYIICSSPHTPAALPYAVETLTTLSVVAYGILCRRYVGQCIYVCMRVYIYTYLE